MDDFQKSIMTEFGFDKLPPEQQAELFGRIGALLMQGITVRALEEMSDEEQDKLDAFLADRAEDPDALIGYLREHVSDFDAIAQDEVARFRASAMELMDRPVA